MKYFLNLGFLFCVMLNAYASNKTNKNLEIQIKSKVNAEIVQIYRIQQGAKVIVDEFPINTNDIKSFKDTISHAFYIVKYNNLERKVYGKTGETIMLEVTDGSINYAKSNKVNKILNNWFQLSEEARQYSVNYSGVNSNVIVQRTPFYSRQRILEDNVEGFYRKLYKCRDKYFKEAMYALVDAEINFFKLYFMQIPLLGYYNRSELPDDLYGTISNEERFANPILLDVFEYVLPYGQLYGGWCQYKEYLKAKPTLDYFISPEIKVAYLLGKAEKDKSGVGLEKIEKGYMHLFKKGYPLQQLKKLQEEFAYLKDPSKTPDFKFQDIEDKEVSFSDFYGKLIVIDVWATWCGPCMKAKPNFEALAEEMKDEDVTFIGISVDDSDLKWKKTASESHCIELRDKGKTFSKAYGLTTIPRYMIFSEEGGVLVHSAPSPNTNDLKKEILKFLDKK